MTEISRDDARHKLEHAARLIIEAIGDDPTRDGLKDTPRRFRDAWIEMTTPGQRHHATFINEGVDQMILVKGLGAWSICEHHLMPFSVVATVAVISGEKVLGLSKFARVVEEEAAKLQIQERLTEQIAQRIRNLAGVYLVAVMVEGKHLCMCARGVRQQNAVMTTSTMHGLFRENPAARLEFLQLCR